MHRLVVVAAATLLACSAERADVSGPRQAQSRPGSGDRQEDPRQRCVREHASDPAHGSEPGVVRALCAELHDLGGVAASVAIVRDDRLAFAVAVGPRCRGGAQPLGVETPMPIGSITKVVTAALALVVAERRGEGLDQRLAATLPELVPAPTLQELLLHTSGLRDPDPLELLAGGDAWPAVLQQHRAEAAGGHAYANANYLLVGRWLERTTGREYAELVATELADVRERVSMPRGGANGSGATACGHRRGADGAWEPLELAAAPPLPAWTIPAGGGLASAEDLARLPFALERSGVLPGLLATRVQSDQPGWDYGFGVRIRGEGDALVVGHSGNTGTHWAELQWSPEHRVAVAVMSSTPQALKATLLAAFEAGMAHASAPRGPGPRPAG